MQKTKHVLSFLEILSHSWKFFSENFLQILAIVLVVYVPIELMQSFAKLAYMPYSPGNFFTPSHMAAIVEFLIGIIATIAIAIFVKAKSAGKKMDFRPALLAALKKWPIVLATNILLSILVAILFMLLIIPGVYFGVYWAFTILAVALSDKKYKGAMDYSKSLVKGRWWKTFGIFLGLGLVVSVVAVLAGLPFTALPGNIFANFAAKTVIDVVVSFFTVAYVILYLNFEKTRAKS